VIFDGIGPSLDRLTF